MSANKTPTMRHHPMFGYAYLPNLKRRMLDPSGGYLLRTNADGFRSEREFERPKRAGVRRVLMFGDSQTAGDGVSNAKRFSDLVDAKLDGLEVYNLGLTGSGTDQQLTIFREFAPVIEHDLVVICVFVENVMRVGRKVFVRPDLEGTIHYYGKPYFEVESDELVLRGVPVPEQRWTAETLPQAFRGAQEEFQLPPVTKPSRLHRWVRRHLPKPLTVRLLPLVRAFVRNRALPAYDKPNTPEWTLLRRMLTTWVRESRAPVLIVPLPLSHFIMDASDARPCQARYAELAADSGCHLFDPLPGLRRLSPQERREVWDHRTGHFSEFGHRALAELLAPVIDALTQAEAPAHKQESRLRA